MRDRRRLPPDEAERRPAGAPAETPVNRVLALQASVGNAAVSRILAREPQVAEEANSPARSRR